jgi:hypothetical protein
VSGPAGDNGAVGDDAPGGTKGTEGTKGAAGAASDPDDFPNGDNPDQETLLVVITSPPPGSVAVNAAFGLTAAVETSQHEVVTSFNGDITIVLATNPGGAVLGGPVTVRASNGVAVFSGLSLNKAGNGYQLKATSGGTSSTPDSLNVVGSPPPPPPPPSPPTIIGETVMATYLKFNKHHKPVGKPVDTFQLSFSTAMDPATAGNVSNYQVGWFSTKKVKKKRVTVLHSLAIKVQYSALSESVSLQLLAPQTFKTGGQITVLAAAPGGVSSALGTLLDGKNEGMAGDNGVFSILPKARGVTRA